MSGAASAVGGRLAALPKRLIRNGATAGRLHATDRLHVDGMERFSRSARSNGVPYPGRWLTPFNDRQRRAPSA